MQLIIKSAAKFDAEIMVSLLLIVKLREDLPAKDLPELPDKIMEEVEGALNALKKGITILTGIGLLGEILLFSPITLTSVIGINLRAKTLKIDINVSTKMEALPNPTTRLNALLRAENGLLLNPGELANLIAFQPSGTETTISELIRTALTFTTGKSLKWLTSKPTQRR
jgi:preprotein translocase subunit YajC